VDPMNHASPFWPQFWPQFWSAVASGVVVGLVFTAGWGLVSGRRESLAAQIAVFTAWTDEIASAVFLQYQLVMALLKNASDFDSMDERERRELLAEIRKAKARTTAAVMRGALVDPAAVIFDDANVRNALHAYVDRVIDTHRALLECEPKSRADLENPETLARLTALQKAINDVFTAGHVAVQIMIHETTFLRVLSYYRHYLRRHYNAS